MKGPGTEITDPEDNKPREQQHWLSVIDLYSGPNIVAIMFFYPAFFFKINCRGQFSYNSISFGGE
jgi:hypothetical protein